MDEAAKPMTLSELISENASLKDKIKVLKMTADYETLVAYEAIDEYEKTQKANLSLKIEIGEMAQEISTQIMMVEMLTEQRKKWTNDKRTGEEDRHGNQDSAESSCR